MTFAGSGLMILKKAIIGEVKLILAECFEANWDGHGSLPISIRSLGNAVNFYKEKLSEGIRFPEITPEPDGQVALEWYGPAGASFSISFDENNYFSYANVLKNNRSHSSGKVETIDTKTIRRQIQNTLRGSASS